MRRFVLLQLCALTAGFAIAYLLMMPATMGALFASALALGLAFCYSRTERWQWALHALLPWALLVGLQLAVPAWIWLIAFIISWLVYAGASRNRVPLYLSNHRAMKLMAAQIPAGAQFLDIGAGTGTVLAWLARHRPDIKATGIELAWLPWLIARLRLCRRPVAVLRGDLFALSLSDYDVVYAYLSPEPMLRLWEKARAEMKPGAILISNSFAIPGQQPDWIGPVLDWKESELYLWRL